MNEIFTQSMETWLLKTSVEGTVLIGIVFLMIAAFGRHLSPRWRVALWTLVGLKLLIPASMTFLPGIGNWSFFSPETPEPAISPTVISQPSAPVVEPAVVEALPADFAPSTVVTSAPGLSLSSWLLILWAAGFIGFLSLLVFKQGQFIRRSAKRYCTDRNLLNLVQEVSAKLKLNRKVPVMLGKPGVTPAVYGMFQPRLLLPEDWQERFDESGLRHILMHELEHVRFGDIAWNWAAALVNAVHWFNPLVWLATSRFQADRELRCDADTLARLEAHDRISYGRTLLHVQKTFHAAPAIAGLAPCVRNHPALRQRIAMITKPTASRSWLNLVFGVALAGLICFSFGSAARADGEREGEGRSSEEGRREGARDGDREREGSRERDGDRPREGARDGERPREGARDGGVNDGELKVRVVRDGVILGDRKLDLIDLRGALENTDAKTAVIYAGEDVPFQNVKTVINALGNSGISNVRFATDEARREGMRDGDRPREGARDGERPREGARDGEGGPREGARDGDMRREGARDGDRPREGARDGDRPREGARDGEGGSREGARDGDMRREGARDGDRPREGARDGERPREGARDGEGEGSREGARDGEMRREGEREGDRPREGARDGDRPREGGREGEGGSREGAREGEMRRGEEGSGSSAGLDDREIGKLSRIYKAYDKDGSNSVTFKEWVAMKNYQLSSEQEEREKGWFDQADANSDGGITLGEWIDWKSSQGR